MWITMTSQGRRKHSACLFRMRENCPFTKLKRNQCIDSRNSVVQVGGQWATTQTQTVAGPSGSNNPINTTASLNSVSHLQDQVSVMDTDPVPSTAGPSYRVSETLNFSLINQPQFNMSSSNTSMDLDTGVDPETGERAQR